MQVKNYIVENRNLFFEYLEKELCQNGISYVRIDNEIHFEDQIIRLYDFELDKDSIILSAFNKIEVQNYTNKILIEVIDSNLLERNFDYYKKCERDNFYNINEKNYQKINKRVQKQQSHKANQTLKMYKK